MVQQTRTIYVLKESEWTTNKLSRALRNVKNVKCILDCRSLKQLRKISTQKFNQDYHIFQTKRLQKRKSPSQVAALIPKLLKKIKFPCLILTIPETTCPGWWVCQELRDSGNYEIHVLGSRGVQNTITHIEVIDSESDESDPSVHNKVLVTSRTPDLDIEKLLTGLDGRNRGSFKKSKRKSQADYSFREPSLDRKSNRRDKADRRSKSYAPESRRPEIELDAHNTLRDLAQLRDSIRSLDVALNSPIYNEQEITIPEFTRMKSTSEDDKRIGRALEEEAEEQASNLHKYIDEIKQLRRTKEERAKEMEDQEKMVELLEMKYKQELRKKEKEITKLEDKWQQKMEDKEREIREVKAKYTRDIEGQRRKLDQVQTALNEMEKTINDPQVQIQKERLAKLVGTSNLASMTEVQVYKHLYSYIFDNIKPRERSRSNQRSRSRSRKPSMSLLRRGERSGSLAESIFEDSAVSDKIQEGVHVRLISRNKKYNGRIGVVVGCCFENRWPVKLGSGDDAKVVKVLDRNLEIHAPPRRARSRSKSNLRRSASRSLAALRPGFVNFLSPTEKNKTRASVVPADDNSDGNVSTGTQGSPPEKLASPGPKEKRKNSMEYFAVGDKVVALSRITKCWYPAKIVARKGASYRIAWESGDPTDTSKETHEIERRSVKDPKTVDIDDELEKLRKQMQTFTSSMIDFDTSPTNV